MGLKKCFGINKFEIMDKIDAYKSLVEIGNAITLAETCIKHKYKLPDTLIARLNKLGDLGSDIEAYAMATGDKDIIKKIAQLPREVLRQENGWYTIGQQTGLSTALCKKSLYKVAKMKARPQAKTNDEETEKEKTYFAKAVEKNLMTKTENGYKWIYGGDRGKARLGYFIKKVFNPNGNSVIPYKRLEILFGITRLDTAVDQLSHSKKPLGWKTAIDNLFE